MTRRPMPTPMIRKLAIPRLAARALSACLLSGLLTTAAPAREVVDARLGLAPVTQTSDRRCTDDGAVCIGLDSYVTDVCRAIERNATENGLDPHFLARLLWKESLFEPGAISPVGAQGIAQFMPGTARMVGLDDPFNPAKAIGASARYLAALTRGLGNIGLAAVAYNGGEARAARFIGGSEVLPYETQDYVEAITGHNAWAWRDNPPGADRLDLRLQGDAPFASACTELAGKRELREFRSEPKVMPWGVIVASHPSRAGAQRLANRVRPLLRGKPLSLVPRRMNGNPRRVFTAQVGYDSKSAAIRFCNQMKTLGGRCIVLKN